MKPVKFLKFRFIEDKIEILQVKYKLKSKSKTGSDGKVEVILIAAFKIHQKRVHPARGAVAQFSMRYYQKTFLTFLLVTCI